MIIITESIDKSINATKTNDFINMQIVGNLKMPYQEFFFQNASSKSELFKVKKVIYVLYFEKKNFSIMRFNRFLIKMMHFNKIIYSNKLL